MTYTKQHFINYEFDPEKSPTAQKILQMSDKELFDRYFVRAQNSNWDIVNEYSTELDKFVPNSANKSLYPKALSWRGTPMNFIITNLHGDVEPYIPQNYKFNMKSILSDVERILGENMEFAQYVSKIKRSDSFSAKGFVAQLADFLSEKCLDGLSYINSLNA